MLRCRCRRWPAGWTRHRPVVETVTGTVPVPAGTTTVSESPEPPTVTEVPALVPKSTVVEPETNPVPLTVTVLVPPGPVVRADRGDRRRRIVGVLVTRGVDRRGAVGGGHPDVDRTGPRRSDHGERVTRAA